MEGMKSVGLQLPWDSSKYDKVIQSKQIFATRSIYSAHTLCARLLLTLIKLVELWPMSVPSTPVLDGRTMGGLVMTDPFHRYRFPMPRRSWGLFSLTWLGSSAGGTSFLPSILIFYGFSQKIISSFIFPIGCVCCWLFVESNPGPGSGRRVQVLYSNIRGLLENLDELAVAGSDYGVLVCAVSKVSDRRHLSELSATFRMRGNHSG